MQVSRITASTPRFAAAPRRAAAVQRTPLRTMALFGGGATKTGSFYDFTVNDIDGKPVKMDKFKGKVALIVNLASACGFTPQYTELAQVYDKYQSKGFTVLGFPCNQFGAQEPGSNANIKQFAMKEYGVKFPLFAKVDVNGASADPLFQWLKAQKSGFLTDDIKWNFSKFLVDREGNVVGRYGSSTTPGSIVGDIEKYL